VRICGGQLGLLLHQISHDCKEWIDLFRSPEYSGSGNRSQKFFGVADGSNLKLRESLHGSMPSRNIGSSHSAKRRRILH